MSAIENENSLNQDTLIKKIQSLENRLSRIELLLRIEREDKADRSKSAKREEEEYTVEKAESRFVEYGLAWLGSVVFVFGIVFLMAYTESLGYVLLAKIIAYITTFLLLGFSYLSKKNFPTLANVLNICSPLLLYYITLRLYFFTEQPVLPSKEVVLSALFLLIGIQAYIAIKRNSEFLGTIAIFLSITTAIISDSTYLTFIILTLTAIGSLLLFHHKLWWKSHLFSLFMVYITHLLWLFNNPIMGHPMKIVESPQFNILFLIGYVILYSSSIFIPKNKLESNAVLVSISIWNILSFSLLLLLIIPSFYKESYVLIFSAITFFCLLYSVILKLKSERRFAPAMYACFGFMAMSIAVYGYAGLPNSYLLLVLQSFLVVSMALWFRSKIIVVANAFLFVSILVIYLIASESIDIINFSFALTALATARILNWQQERLTLKTDGFRNVYLFITFFMVLYSLNKALPSYYVTLAWTGSAIVFFMLSVLLKKIKYRYMAILTIVVTAGHLFFVDLGQMEIGYRVVAFLVFALISLGVSLYYTKRINKK